MPSDETKQLAPIPGPMPQTEEWKQIRLFDVERPERPIVFGASEAAECLNISPYSGGPLEVFMRKRQLKPPFEGNEATRFGLLIEPVVLTLYEEETGDHLVRDLPMYFHGEHSFMAATPDALVDVEGARSGPLIEVGVDAKSSTYRMVDKSGEDVDKFGEPGTDQVPRYILAQAQQQCAVLNLSRVRFPVLFNRSIQIYTVERNNDFIAALVSAEQELAERIMNNDPPEPNWSHPSTEKLLRELYGFTPRKVVELPDDYLDEVALLLNAQAAEKLASKQVKEHKNKLRAALQDAESGVLPDGTEIRRSVVKDAPWTQDDVDKAEACLGMVKRAGHERLIIRKAK